MIEVMDWQPWMENELGSGTELRAESLPVTLSLGTTKHHSVMDPCNHLKNSLGFLQNSEEVLHTGGVPHRLKRAILAHKSFRNSSSKI